MTTQEISRYIAVASRWEEKYSQAKVSADIMQSTFDNYQRYVNTLESQLKIQDKAIERKDAEIKKLNNVRSVEMTERKWIEYLESRNAIANELIRELNARVRDLKSEINIYQKKYYRAIQFLGISHCLLIILGLLYWGII